MGTNWIIYLQSVHLWQQSRFWTGQWGKCLLRIIKHILILGENICYLSTSFIWLLKRSPDERESRHKYWIHQSKLHYCFPIVKDLTGYPKSWLRPEDYCWLCYWNQSDIYRILRCARCKNYRGSVNTWRLCKAGRWKLFHKNFFKREYFS